MVKQTNIPKLRFPEFKDKWEKKKLGEVAERVTSKNSSNDIKNVFTNSAVQGIVNQRDFFDKDIANQNNLLNYYVVEKNDFIYNPRISNFAPVGPISRNHLDTGVMSPLYSVFKFKKGDLDFFETYFSTTLWHEYLESIANYGARFDRMNITVKDFYEMPLPFPTLPEQTKIAEFFTAIDAKIQALKTKKEKLQQYKKGVMQQLFSQELRFKDENGKAFPKWEMKKLGEVAKITTGSSNRQDSNLDGKYTFFDRSIDIRTSDRFLFDTEAIIVPGEGQEFIPKYFKGKFDLHQRTYAIMDFEGINGTFLFYSISFNTNHLNSHAVGSTVKSLRLPMFETMPINLPSLPDQTKIANFLSSIDEKINRTETQIQQTQAWKKGLLQNMFV
jgi:type I restriction enzyme S subunit